MIFGTDPDVVQPPIPITETTVATTVPPEVAVGFTTPEDAIADFLAQRGVDYLGTCGQVEGIGYCSVDNGDGTYAVGAINSEFDAVLTLTQASDGTWSVTSSAPFQIDQSEGPLPAERETVPVDQLDLTAGFLMFESPDQLHDVYALRNVGLSGCEGGPAWDIWSVPKDGSDAVRTMPQGVISSEPSAWISTTNNYVAWVSICGDSTTLLVNQIQPDGSFADTRIVEPGGFVQSVSWQDDGQLSLEVKVGSDLVFMTVDPATGQVVAEQPLDLSASTNCSAAGLDVALPDDPALSPAVLQLRNDIFEAAMACDYEQLNALAPADLSYTFGGPFDSPGYYWARQELLGTGEPMSWLARLLALPATSTTVEGLGDMFIWPSVSGRDATDATAEEIAQLRELGVSEDEINFMLDGSGYLGYRIGIMDDGTWMYFIAGD